MQKPPAKPLLPHQRNCESDSGATIVLVSRPVISARTAAAEFPSFLREWRREPREVVLRQVKQAVIELAMRNSQLTHFIRRFRYGGKGTLRNAPKLSRPVDDSLLLQLLLCRSHCMLPFHPKSLSVNNAINRIVAKFGVHCFDHGMQLDGG